MIRSSKFGNAVHGCLVVFLIVGSHGNLLAGGKNTRPNVLILLADDLGYGDLACTGSKTVRSPHLDRLAREGMRFTHGYAAGANCSPSRAGLLTGRTPTRAGIYNWIPMLSPMHLREREITLATLLRRAGYATAQIGKWHLNGMFNLPGQPQPGDHGFDHWFATQNNALPNHKDPYNFVRNGIPMGPRKGYSADIVAEESIRWLKEGRPKDRPFFLYVCFHEPHEPIASAKEFAGLYADLEPSRAAHHGNISQMDAGVGRILQALEELKLAGETLVLFTSDNGPAITRLHPHGSTGGLRAKKGFLYEGGIRVPLMLRWPGKIPVGKTSEVPICGVDVLPTVCELAGIEAPRDRILDGTSIVPVLEGRKLERRRPLYWHFHAVQDGPQVALREGDWMLLGHLDRKIEARGDILESDQEALRKASPVRFELYDLRSDPGQKEDRAGMEPDRTKRMAAALKKVFEEVRQETPSWPAWTFPRYEAGRIEWAVYPKKDRP